MRHERNIEDVNPHPLIRRLVETRKAWQLSTTDVAERCGSNHNTFMRYETGQTFPSGKMLVRWAEVLGFDLSLWPKSRG